MNGIFLLLGSNMGNRLDFLREAERILIARGIKIMDESSVYETEPWGKKDQNWFLNVVLEVETAFSPNELLHEVLAVEQEIGRVRKEKWGERSIDIDILYYHNQVIDSETLIIPHPGIPNRRFTLIPLAEMIPLEKHPLLAITQMQMLADCKDELDCELTDYKL